VRDGSREEDQERKRKRREGGRSWVMGEEVKKERRMAIKGKVGGKEE